MGVIRSLGGMVRLELTSADIAQSVEALTEMGVTLYDVESISELTVSFRTDRANQQKVEAYAARKGLTCRVLRREGAFWRLRSLWKRPFLLLGMAAYLALSLYVPGRIYFVEVEGNEQIPQRQILEAAARSGIGFGASRREVRSEKMKNALLSELPQLQWAGVNTYGCRAVITVRERSAEETVPERQGVSSIVAARDGVILSATVTRGSGLVAPGQAVREGEVLISGYTDCGLTIEATRAEGEVTALTRRDLSVLTLPEQHTRTAETKTDVKYSLILGKKRINFYKDSGICDGSCVKMYSKYVLTLPGGFQLPVALVRETVTGCETDTNAIEEDVLSSLLSGFAERYLKTVMIAGTILDRQETLEQTDVCRLTGQYECQEMIGRVKPEEIGVYHGKTD